MNRVLALGLCLLATAGVSRLAFAAEQDARPLDSPAVAPLPEPPGQGAGDPQGSPVKPLTEGPLHEAFLSPAKDRAPTTIEKGPPAPLTERPGVDPPSANALWIEGYWDWDAGRKDFVWVTGTWRVPPPGRFWVNGYWKRSDQGWYRVPGFWSDRKTDRIDFRKNGPPADHPADEPGESPGDAFFYVPGQYYPDADGVLLEARLGPGPSQAGRGSPLSGSSSPKAGRSRKVTGIARSKIAARSSPPRRSTRRQGTATSSTSRSLRSRRKTTACSTALSAGPTPTTTATRAASTTPTAATTATRSTAHWGPIMGISITHTMAHMVIRTTTAPWRSAAFLATAGSDTGWAMGSAAACSAA